MKHFNSEMHWKFLAELFEPACPDGRKLFRTQLLGVKLFGEKPFRAHLQQNNSDRRSFKAEPFGVEPFWAKLWQKNFEQKNCYQFSRFFDRLHANNRNRIYKILEEFWENNSIQKNSNNSIDLKFDSLKEHKVKALYYRNSWNRTKNWKVDVWALKLSNQHFS